jgi:hypothetical protein
MKINKKQLQNIISESIKRVLKEWDSDDWDERYDFDEDYEDVESRIYLIVDLKTLEIVKGIKKEQYLSLAMKPEGNVAYTTIYSDDFSGAYRGKCTFSGSYYQPAEYDDDCFGTCNSFKVEEFIVPDSYEEHEDELCKKFITKNDEKIKKCLEESAEFC